MLQHSLRSILPLTGTLFVIVSSLALVPEAAAQDGAAGSSVDADATLIDITAPVGSQSGQFGLGMGSSFPAYGISGTYRVNEQVTAEAILGAMGAVTSLAGRGWYRFQQDPTYDLYGYVTAGMYRHEFVRFSLVSPGSDTETVFGIGGGAGIELSWAKILDKPDFLPIYSNLDLGFVFANFEHYDWSGLAFGGGIHYRFGGK